MNEKEKLEKVRLEERERIFRFLDHLNLVEKDDLAKFKKFYPFLTLPEEMLPFEQWPEAEKKWALEVVKRYEERHPSTKPKGS